MTHLSKKAGAVIAAILMLFVFFTGRAVLQPGDELYPRDPDAENDVISIINRYRIRDGRTPLLRNPDLDYLAMQQADYIKTWMPFTSENIDYHIDEFGDGLQRRAELIDWTPYGIPGQMYLSEIAAYYPSVQGMMNFWNNSEVHRRAIYEYGYREIGVAVIRNKNWMLAYVVMGARPQVLPVLYEPNRNMLLLTTDQSPFSDRFVPSRVQILNGDGRRLHDDEWLLWKFQIPLPRGAGSYITVVYSDGIREVRTSVDLFAARVYPSEPINLPTPIRVIYLTPAVNVTATFAPPPPTPAAVDTAAYDMRAQYDGLSLVLVNQSGHHLNLEPLAIFATQLGITLNSEWLGRFSEVSPGRFPPGYCLQLWSFEQSFSPPPIPADCQVRASGRSILGLSQRFWLAGSFDMLYEGHVIARCAASAGVCPFNILDE